MKDEVNLFEFTEKFPDEQACINFLEKARWGNEPVTSPFTKGEAYRIKSRPGLFKCKDTGKQFSVRVGTIFEESRLPLKKWFYAIFILHSLKKGISSIQLAKYIGITQKTAWFMLQRIRYAIEHENFSKPLKHVVEIDETYFGGSRKGTRGRGAANKTPIVGVAERKGDIRCETTENVKTRTLEPIIRKNVEIGSQLMTDEFPVYNPVSRWGYKHGVINHGRKEYVNGEIHTNTIEGFWSHLKKGIKAIQIHVSKKHLNKYCKEYQFRYNHRGLNDFERFRTWFGICQGRLTYRTLIQG